MSVIHLVQAKRLRSLSAPAPAPASRIQDEIFIASAAEKKQKPFFTSFYPLNCAIGGKVRLL
jgi:hypothetical protein